MATISNIRFAISTEPLNNRSTITVTCDVEFTSESRSLTIGHFPR
jgi:hypothetical protein